MTRLVAAVLITAAFFLSAIFVLPIAPSQDIPYVTLAPMKTVALAPHDPIVINGNTGFTGPNASTGITRGSGTSSDPYVIENWEISFWSTNGISISSSDVYFVIQDCYVHDLRPNGMAILIYLCSHGTIRNCTFSNDYIGIWLGASSDNCLINNTCSNCMHGIDLAGIYLIDSSDNNSLINNNCSVNSDGIHLADAFNNRLINNNCSSNFADGVYLGYSFNNTLVNNNCSSNYHGIRLLYSDESNLVNNTCSDNYHGIYLEYGSSNNVITNNTCSMNDDAGICVEGSGNSTISGNICEWNAYYGINVRDSSNSSVVSNICDLVDGEGIHIYSNDCRVVNNICTSDRFGMTIHNGENATLEGNTIIGLGLMIEGDYLLSYNTHMISTTNTVNGRPFNYFKNISGGTIPFCEGPILLANCSEVIVEDQLMNDIAIGVELAYCTGITVERNIWMGNGIGVRLIRSNNCTLTNNTFINNSCWGIDLEYSDNNFVESNWVENSSSYGIAIWWSASNMIWNNTLINNNGAGDTYDWDHVQAYDDGSDNWWNNTDGYGNYWSDWTTPDVDEPFGIVDLPYQIRGDADAHDYYPLTAKPTEPIPEFGMMPFVVMVLLVAIVLTIGARRRYV